MAFILTHPDVEREGNFVSVEDVCDQSYTSRQGMAQEGDDKGGVVTTMTIRKRSTAAARLNARRVVVYLHPLIGRSTGSDNRVRVAVREDDAIRQTHTVMKEADIQRE